MTSRLKALVDFYRACDRPKLPDDAVQFSVDVDVNRLFAFKGVEKI